MHGSRRRHGVGKEKKETGEREAELEEEAKVSSARLNGEGTTLQRNSG